MPTIDELTAYAARESIGISCKEAHISWAIGLAIDAEDWEYVHRASQLRRSIGRRAA